MNILDLIEKYSVKKDRQIKKICEPLAKLGIPYLWHYFVEKDGRFGAITNDPEYANLYMGSKAHLNYPYYADPAYFRSGYSFIPSAFENDYRQLNMKDYQMDHTFLVLKTNYARVEGFVFYERNLDNKNLSFYLNNIDLLEKFISYFKRETKKIIVELESNSFSIKKERGVKFFETDGALPLVRKNSKANEFLKKVYGLSPQEERCHELLKQGYTAQGVAAILNISNRTVETHICNIKNKFKCGSKFELLNN